VHVDELPLTGFTVAVAAAVPGLAEAGATVVPVEQLLAAQVDCVVFTSATAVTALLTAATEALLGALQTEMLVACTDPAAAALLERLGVPTVRPASPDALLAALVAELPDRRTRAVRAGPHQLRMRSQAVLVDGQPVPLTARQSGVLGALVAGQGRVLSRAELLRLAWRDEPADEHAVEMTVARLRTALGPAGKVVQTVIKRGYRLAAPTPPP
jgi:uroporphyrinogen-III synthase